jgi:hypothetical protein
MRFASEEISRDGRRTAIEVAKAGLAASTGLRRRLEREHALPVRVRGKHRTGAYSRGNAAMEALT